MGVRAPSGEEDRAQEECRQDDYRQTRRGAVLIITVVVTTVITLRASEGARLNDLSRRSFEDVGVNRGNGLRTRGDMGHVHRS